jgi:hypothetical protein
VLNSNNLRRRFYRHSSMCQDWVKPGRHPLHFSQIEGDRSEDVGGRAAGGLQDKRATNSG